MKTSTEPNHAEQQAIAQLESIREMVKALQDAEVLDESGDGYRKRESALAAILEDPLEITTRSDWHSPGAESKDAEFCILLCTGGPAVRIIGELSEHGEPEKARIESQDWGTPWTEYRITSEDEEILLAYCRCFYFGE